MTSSGLKVNFPLPLPKDPDKDQKTHPSMYQALEVEHSDDLSLAACKAKSSMKVRANRWTA